MKIKIKVKTLIVIVFLFVFTLIWGIPTSILSIANLLEYYHSDKATIFYEKYYAYPTSPTVKGSYSYAKSLVKSFSKYTIFYNGWGSRGNTSPEGMEKSKAILEDIVNNKSYKASEKQVYMDSYKMLLDMAIATGDVEMLYNWILFGQNSEDTKLRYISDVYNGFLLHVNGDSDGAKAIVAKYESSDLADVKLDILKAEITLFDEKYEESKEIYKNISMTKWKNLQGDNFGSTGYYDRDYLIESVMDEFKGSNVIRGTVTYEGKPMPFVEIYVQESDGGFRSGGEGYVGITNEKGEFETLGLKDGVYNVGIGIEGALLVDKVLQRPSKPYFELNGDGEINFEFKNTMNIITPESNEKIEGEEFTVSWEKVEKASYYTVEIVGFSDPYKKNSSYAGAIYRLLADKNGNTKFTETKVTFYIELLKSSIGGMTRGDEGILGYDAVLGLFLPEVKYPIVVNAYDEDNKLITSSLSLRTYYDQLPSVAVEGSLTEGEKLIVNHNYPEAIKYYENVLIDEPNNGDALRYLTKIYGIGWKYGEKNIERALELGKRYTDVTGDNILLNNIIEMMEIDEIKKNSELFYSAILETQERSGNNYYSLSRYYIATENWEEAKNALQKVEGYASEKLVYLNMYFGNYLEAIENIKYVYSSSLKSIKATEALKALDNIPPHPNDKQLFNDFLLKIVVGVGREEGKKLYEDIINQISNNNIKTILSEIYIDRGWGNIH